MGKILFTFEPSWGASWVDFEPRPRDDTMTRHSATRPPGRRDSILSRPSQDAPRAPRTPLRPLGTPKTKDIDCTLFLGLRGPKTPRDPPYKPQKVYTCFFSKNLRSVQDDQDLPKTLQEPVGPPQDPFLGSTRISWTQKVSTVPRFWAFLTEKR